MYTDRNIISGKLFNIPKFFVGILVLVVAIGMIDSSFAESQTNSQENDFAGKECHNEQIQSGNHCDQNNCSKEDEKSGNKCGYGAIHGQKYNDLNRNGIHDEGEPFLNGWTIFFDKNNNETFDMGEKYRITHDDPKGNPGHYWFTKLPKGDYTVCEVLKTKWIQTQPGTEQEPQCYDVTIESSGQRFEDLDFGNHYPVNGGTTLTVIKEVINDNGGTANPSDFTINVKNPKFGSTSFAGESGVGVILEIAAGKTIVTEDSFSGYKGDGGKGDCNFVAELGKKYKCIITNNDEGERTKLTVIKDVINDDGGTSKPSDFIMIISSESNPSKNHFEGSSDGTTVEINTGHFVVTESESNDYFSKYDGCDDNAAKDVVFVCIITNNDKDPEKAYLTVYKDVINDNGGTAKSSDFTMIISPQSEPDENYFSGSDIHGTTVEINPGEYSVDESGPEGYEKSLSSECIGTAQAGNSYECTITNDDHISCPPGTVLVLGECMAEPNDRFGEEWDTRPTFGISHEDLTTPLVEKGFSFNLHFFGITDNHHTPFEEQQVRIGEDNEFRAKVYADKGLKIQEFLFGIPEVGKGHLAEMRIEVWYGTDGKPDDVKIIPEDSTVVDPTSITFDHQKSKCQQTDEEKKCDTTIIEIKFLEPLADNIMAIKAIDFKLRGQTTYLNDGLDISGESLNPKATKMIPSPIKGEGLVKVTQNKKYSNYWTADDGRLFEMNSFGSFKQINKSFERNPDSGNAFKRLHSNFEKIIDYEKTRALKIFNSTSLQSELPDSFAYVFPESHERIDEEMIQKMISEELIAQQVFDGLHTQHRWN